MVHSVIENKHIVLFYGGLLLLLQACSPTSKLNHSQVEQGLMTQFGHWQGAPYRWGGMTTTGVDCSAFILIVYRDAFGITLPRNTSDQMNSGTRIHPKRLTTGDLVFFRTGKQTLHVGIVLSNGKMMHASTSNGVEITELNQPYWIRRFIGARRVL